MGEVAFDEVGIVFTTPSGAADRIEWAELQAVEIVTTDTGPFAEDVFWALYGSGQPLILPQSVAGSDALLSRLQELPGFDNRAVIAAMSSVGSQRFPCWAREPVTGR